MEQNTLSAEVRQKLRSGIKMESNIADGDDKPAGSLPQWLISP
jgi:hypothetical protein